MAKAWEGTGSAQGQKWWGCDLSRPGWALLSYGPGQPWGVARWARKRVHHRTDIAMVLLEGPGIIRLLLQ